MRRVGHPPSALCRDRGTCGASGVVRGHIAPATLAVVRAELRLAFRHVAAAIRYHARGVVSVDASHSGKYSFDPLSFAPPKKTPNKASHPTPTRWVVRRFLASILVLGLHSLRTSIRGGWTRRSEEESLAPHPRACGFCPSACATLGRPLRTLRRSFSQRIAGIGDK